CEEVALLEARAFATCGGLEPVADEDRPFDRLDELRQLSRGHVAQLLDRGLITGRRVEQRLRLFERQAGTLRRVDHGQRTNRVFVVAALTADPGRLGQQTYLFVVADRRRAAACTPGQLADRQKCFRHEPLTSSRLEDAAS